MILFSLVAIFIGRDSTVWRETLWKIPIEHTVSIVVECFKII
jgi:hypothetical protein